MDRDKQIEELARVLGEGRSQNCSHYVCCSACPCDFCCIFQENAHILVQEGYRKASEVAEEIFTEMREELVRYLMLNENIAIKCKEENGEWNAEYWKGKLSAFKQIQGFIDVELKKKYTEDRN